MSCITDLLADLDTIPDKSRVNLFAPIQLCVGNVINQVLFGYIFVHGTPSAERFLHFVDIITRFLTDLISKETVFYQAWPWLIHVPLINRTYKRMEREYHHSYMRFIMKEVEAQRREFSPTAPVTTFVQAYLAEIDKGVNSHLCVEQLYTVVSDFWFAGVETTATTLRWALLYMVKYPDIQAKVYDEIQRVVGHDRYPAMSDKPAMPYMTAVIHEVQRLPGIVGMNFRITDSAQTIADHSIPPDTAYLLLLVRAMTGPQFDEPQEFRPERWLSEDGVTIRKELLQYLIPFSVGRRQCPGEGLAKMELFLVLSTLLQRYEFHAVGKADTTPVYGEVLYPKDYRVRMVKRQ